MPVLEVEPLESTKEHRVYRTSTGVTYRIPAELTLSLTPNGRVQAVSFERSSSNHLIFISNLSGSTMTGQPPYPVRRLDLRPITGTMDSNDFRVTLVPGSVERAPFSSLVVIQVLGSKNIESFKGLLQTGAGFLLEARFDVAFAGLGTREVSIPVTLGQAVITEQTN